MAPSAKSEYTPQRLLQAAASAHPVLLVVMFADVAASYLEMAAFKY